MADQNFHVGLISDGIRRWSKKNNKSFHDAYKTAGIKLVQVINWLFEKDVDLLSIYMLSRDNLKRSKKELDPVIKFQVELIKYQLPEISQKWNCSFSHSGNIDILPNILSN